MINCYSVEGELTSPRFCRAFADGCGGKVYSDGEYRTGDIALFGSTKVWHLVEQARREKIDFYYGDHAYFGRGQYYRVTKNALQVIGNEGGNSNRFDAFNIPIKPWRATGSHILLCPNSPAFFELYKTTFEAWYWHVKEELKHHTDRPIRLRWKRDAVEVVPLEQDLEDCWAVVVFTSNCAVDAALAGVPTFATEQCAGLHVGSADLSQIERPYYPTDKQRLDFASTLASNQWTMDEIKTGVAWEHLKQC